MLENRTLRGSVFALLTTVIWSGNFVSPGWPWANSRPMTWARRAGWWRCSSCACFDPPQVKREWPVARTFLPQILVDGLTAVTSTTRCATSARHPTSAINLALISVTTPIFIVHHLLPGWAKKQAVNTWVGCTIALVGSIYLVANGELGAWLGLQFAFGDISSCSARGLRCRGVQHRDAQGPRGAVPKHDPHADVFFGLIMLTPFLIWGMVATTARIEASGTVIFSILYTGVGNSLIAWWLWNLALEHAGAARAGMIYYALPLLSGLFGYLFIGETMGMVHLVSGILIVGGILWSNRAPKAGQAPARTAPATE
jgi:drug/metabolite transporter (DMT)-like permease